MFGQLASAERREYTYKTIIDDIQSVAEEIFNVCGAHYLFIAVQPNIPREEWKIDYVWENNERKITRLDPKHKTWVIHGALDSRQSLVSLGIRGKPNILRIPQAFLNASRAALVTIDGTSIPEDKTTIIQSIIANMIMRISDFKTHQYHNAFVANLTHKIRTPLNGILYMGSLLAETALDDTQQEYMDVISKASVSLASVVSDTVDISRLAFRQMTLKKEVISLRECAEDSCQLVEDEAQTKKIKVEIYIEASVPDYIYCDYRRLRQMLYILLHNSISFNTKTDGTGNSVVHVQATLLPTSELDSSNGGTLYVIEFTVSDNGIGMSETSSNSALDSFWSHLDDSNISIGSETDLQSSGLGLAIAQKLAQLMNGDLWIKSTEPDKGSVFVFNIIAPEDEYPSYITHSSLKNIKGKHALIVDTDAHTKIRLHAALTKWGMDCTLAASSDETTMIHFKNPKPIHIMFIADQLLKMRGIDLARLARVQGFTFPIVIISMAGTEALSGNRDITSVLISPVDEKELMTATISLLSEKESKSDIRDCEILVAEDDAVNQLVIEKLLARIGYTKVTIKSNGREALNEIQKNPYKYEICLLDIRMPVLDGIKLSELIYDMYQNNLHKPESQPFMVGVSAQPILDTDPMGKLQAFVPKPIDVKQLEDYLNNRHSYMQQRVSSA